MKWTPFQSYKITLLNGTPENGSTTGHTGNSWLLMDLQDSLFSSSNLVNSTNWFLTLATITLEQQPSIGYSPQTPLPHSCSKPEHCWLLQSNGTLYSLPCMLLCTAQVLVTTHIDHMIMMLMNGSEHTLVPMKVYISIQATTASLETSLGPFLELLLRFSCGHLEHQISLNLLSMKNEKLAES